MVRSLSAERKDRRGDWATMDGDSAPAWVGCCNGDDDPSSVVSDLLAWCG